MAHNYAQKVKEVCNSCKDYFKTAVAVGTIGAYLTGCTGLGFTRVEDKNSISQSNLTKRVNDGTGGTLYNHTLNKEGLEGLSVGDSFIPNVSVGVPFDQSEGETTGKDLRTYSNKDYYGNEETIIFDASKKKIDENKLIKSIDYWFINKEGVSEIDNYPDGEKITIKTEGPKKLTSKVFYDANDNGKQDSGESSSSIEYNFFVGEKKEKDSMTGYWAWTNEKIANSYAWTKEKVVEGYEWCAENKWPILGTVAVGGIIAALGGSGGGSSSSEVTGGRGDGEIVGIDGVSGGRQ